MAYSTMSSMSGAQTEMPCAPSTMPLPPPPSLPLPPLPAEKSYMNSSQVGAQTSSVSSLPQENYQQQPQSQQLEHAFPPSLQSGVTSSPYCHPHPRLIDQHQQQLGQQQLGQNQQQAQKQPQRQPQHQKHPQMEVPIQPNPFRPQLSPYSPSSATSPTSHSSGDESSSTTPAYTLSSATTNSSRPAGTNRQTCRPQVSPTNPSNYSFATPRGVENLSRTATVPTGIAAVPRGETATLPHARLEKTQLPCVSDDTDGSSSSPRGRRSRRSNSDEEEGRSVLPHHRHRHPRRRSRSSSVVAARRHSNETSSTSRSTDKARSPTSSHHRHHRQHRSRQHRRHSASTSTISTPRSRSIIADAGIHHRKRRRDSAEKTVSPSSRHSSGISSPRRHTTRYSDGESYSEVVEKKKGNTSQKIKTGLFILGTVAAATVAARKMWPKVTAKQRARKDKKKAQGHRKEKSERKAERGAGRGERGPERNKSREKETKTRRTRSVYSDGIVSAGDHYEDSRSSRRHHRRHHHSDVPASPRASAYKSSSPRAEPPRRPVSCGSSSSGGHWSGYREGDYVPPRRTARRG